MKIKSVKIYGDNFRSLAANKLYEFNTSFREDRLSTKIFAGLNGSGKSNFLELFSEIFYYLELYHLDTVSNEEKESKNFGFEIEYFLPMIKPTSNILDFENAIEFDMLVKIVKPLGEKPEFTHIPFGKNEFVRVDEMTEIYLPPRIIAYTSGQNELLSNPYYKLKYHYFKLFENKKKYDDGENVSENHRLFYLDYNANFSIFIANMLLAKEEKLSVLKNMLKLEDLKSFRITINTDDLYQKVIPVSDAIAENIEKLKCSATTWVEKKVGKYNLLILDFSIDPSIKASFKHFFNNSFNLFRVFYELEIFNLYLVNKTTRNLIVNAHKSLNITDELPKADPSRLVFRIEKIVVNKIVEDKKPPKPIYYKSLSDGEHQFNEVLGTVLMMQEEGCLFLMDEPDTHFNPMWRAKMIEMLNEVSVVERDKNGEIIKVRNQEIILTTHSPFVIGDSQREDVYKFENNNGVISYENPEIETYGSSVDYLLKTFFKTNLISNESYNKLKYLIEKGTLEELRKAIDEFGESSEKQFLFRRIFELTTKGNDNKAK